MVVRWLRHTERPPCLIDDDEVHIIASGTHSIDKRPPMLTKAMALVEKLGRAAS